MMKGKFLITTEKWFNAPDGKSYNSAWGEVEILEDSFLGIKTNRQSSNWYAKVGGNGREIFIAGCQIHYVVKSEEVPYTGEVEDWGADGVNFSTYTRPTKIYVAEKI